MALRIEAPRSTARNPGATRPDGSSGEKALREPHDARGPRPDPPQPTRALPRPSTRRDPEKEKKGAGMIKSPPPVRGHSRQASARQGLAPVMVS
jgi:hypothetical protein